MEDTAYRAIAIVGAGCVLPDAPNVAAFWQNIKNSRYSITEVPADRWDPALYYDPDHSVPDKTYSKIGGWVREHPWDPVKWRMPIPPRVAAAMDLSQQWGIACTLEALEDYGYPKRSLDLDRVAVIVGNAMGGEMAYLTSLRVYFPEYARELAESKTFAALPEAIRRDIARELHGRIGKLLPEVTEDSMPGELANCLAGRIANIFNLHGPNYTADAACASAMAAITSAVNGLVANDYDVAIAGGVDRNMGAPTFVKFCKIGALSATGSRPFAEGADGFVMGEGAAIFLMKRLADAERDGDKIYAVLRGIAGSSDGKGKGITAPNPVGQKFAIERAWRNAGLAPTAGTMIEGHGTSTRVGDAVEVESMASVLGSCNLPVGSVALGSVKSNFGHLKGGAGAAGMLKAVLALRDKVLPPSVNCPRPNPNIDFTHSPLYVNTELRPWTVPGDGVRRAALSAFGFGGTNFHAVFEEYIPHRLNGNGKRSATVGVVSPAVAESGTITATEGTHMAQNQAQEKAPLRGALVIGAATEAVLAERLRSVQQEAEAGRAPAPAAPALADLRAPERIVIDYGDAAELADKAGKAIKALAANQTPIWKALRAQGVFRGQGPAPKVAFLYTGQGSQYVNMMKALRDREPVVAQAFADADKVMTPLLGKPLSDYIFVDGGDAAALAKAEEDLRQTAITQPAVIATDIAFTRLLAAYGIVPDMAMGHSVGEYGALVASGALPFEDAIEAVSARGREMTRVSWEDNGKMVAVFAPLTEIERIVKTIDGYVVVANINSNSQAVIGGGSKAVDRAAEAFLQAGYNAVPLPVSHAFHTTIVAPASAPLLQMLQRLRFQAPRIPIITNVTGKFYPTGSDVVPQMLDLLSRQVASPVQFVEGLNTLYEAGARVFVETGPKKALQGFADDVLGSRADVVALFTNHPKIEEITAFNQTLCGLYAAGLGRGRAETAPEVSVQPAAAVAPRPPVPQPAVPAPAAVVPAPPAMVVPPLPAAPPAAPLSVSGGAPGNGSAKLGEDNYVALGRMFADVLDRGWQITRGHGGMAAGAPVAISGAALGLPGTERIFDDGNVGRILKGQQFIDQIPNRFRHAMVDKHINRLIKSDNGGPVFENIDNVADVLKLAGRGGAFDIEKEFGVAGERIPSLDRVTQLAIAAGLDALRDAGIPLVMHYKTTSKGTLLPERWGLPDAMRDDTGVIFGAGFPGYDAYADEMKRYYEDHARRQQLAVLEDLRARLGTAHSDGVAQELDRHIDELRTALAEQPYVFDRRFIFKVLAMGHSQFAELIGARGPNTHINAACASTTQGIALAQDWIHTGRCRRVVVIAADDVTSEHLMEWMGSGFLASGAAATGAIVEETALPFDRRRNGMVLGMGAAALVVESAEAVRERGIRPICEVLSTVVSNSAFHGSRLDVQHIGQMMETLVSQAESQAGIARQQIAPQTVFVSHETYTPARGGSASAEINALRRVFGAAADSVVIANTKGFTGHAMGAGIEDVVAVKALETGCVPPVANFKEVDPELGQLNLSKGGAYPVEYALRLAAGFGSQICMALLRWVKSNAAARPRPNALGYSYRIADQAAWNNWLARMTGQPAAELEVAQRTLRVRDTRAAARLAEAAPEVQAAPVQAPPVFLPEKKPSAPAISLVAKPAAKAAAAAAAAPAIQPQTVPPAPRVEAVKPPAPAAPPVAAVASDVVKDRILALVVEKTGYPQDMLDLELDLEADLGVDTVKQAELLASVRGIYDIPRDENLKLRDFPTLARVIQFVYDRRPDLAAAKTAAAVAPPSAPAPVQAQPVAIPQAPAPVEAAGDPVKERILELVVEKTGYPKDMLDLELDLEADLGVDTVKQAELLASVRGIYDIPRDENLKLRDFPTLSKVIQFVYDRRPDLAQAKPAPVSQAAVPAETAPLQAVAPATTPATTNAPVAPAAEAVDHVRERVLDLVVEKTGYPKDMLDLGLDLEADLGVDTVKQAELLSSIRAIYDIPRDENLKLRDYPTLGHVIQFVYSKRPELAAQAGAASHPQTDAVAAPAAAPAPAVPQAAALGSLEAANSIPRRVPVPNLRPPLAVCKPTAATLSAGQRVVLMPDQGGAGEALTQLLQARGVEVLRIAGAPDAKSLVELLKGWAAAGPIQGVYWLPALDNEGSLTEMDLGTWREALRLRLKSLYTAMRGLYEQIAAPGTFLVSATRLGGQHGYDEAGATAPLGGPVVGFTKAYKRERMDALVKAVDFELDRNSSEVAQLLLDETLRDPGAVEIGYKAGQRWTVGLEEQPAADGQPGLTLDKDTVFVITGAAGGITSAITADLAAASGGTFYLLDLVPEPDSQNPDLKRFATDRDGLKRDLIARIQARGERATPAQVEKELAALERAVAAWKAIEAVQNAGGTAHYLSVNLTAPEGVARVIEQVRERSGRIDVLLHAAGMERSHFLPDKDPREFDLVFDVKSDGWFNLLRAIGDMPLGATVAFSSIAGRFGNGGQADYSSANDLLCKITSSFRTVRPGTRGIAIDWTAWGGIGMATRGSIPKMMELAGIDMLPPEAGIPTIRRELTAGATRGEVVVAQRLGILVQEFDATGGLDPAALEEKEAREAKEANTAARGPMTGRIASLGIQPGLTVQTTLDPKVQPFLYDHQIEGIPVLPGVMGIEAFAEAALRLLPGWQIEAVEDVNFLAPFKFFRHEPREITVQAVLAPQGDGLVADCRLLGSRQLPNQDAPQITTHFTACVRLARQVAEPESAKRGKSRRRARTAKPVAEVQAPVAINPPSGATITASDIYQAYFHGPAYRVLEQAWRDGERIVGLMSDHLPPNHQPSDLPVAIAPRLIELCFQTAGLWELGVLGRMGLPLQAAQVCLLRSPDLAEGRRLYAVATPDPEQGSFDVEVVDEAGIRYLQLSGYRTIALPTSINAEPLRVLSAVA